MKYSSVLFFSFLFLLITANSYGQEERLVEHSKAPKIFAKDVKGNPIRLQNLLKENEKVLVCFLRPIWCPICNHQTHQLMERYEELKAKGVEVVAIYPTREETLAEYVRDHDIPFAVIADPDEMLYQQYAVERNMKKVMAAVKREDIKKVYKKGQELFKGKTYPRKDDAYDPIINADFVVGAKRVLEVAYYGEYAGDHYSLDEL